MNRKKRLKVFIFLCVFAAVIFAFPLNPFADENKEKIEHQAGFYYTIQKGDTLWDLSERFSDSPWQWPDLWHENSQIPNPHWIYPGERIRLFYKKGFETIATTKSTPVKKKSPELLVKKKPLPKKKSVYYFYPSINKVGFIKKEPVEPSGSIFSARNDKVIICYGDVVYVKQHGATTFVPGDKYIVYRTLKPKVDKNSDADVGTQYYFTGIIEITKTEPLFAVAQVIQSFRAIKLNELLMPYKHRLPEIAITESKKELDGEVISSEEHGTIIGDHSIAFINKGNKDGVLPGQWYNVYYQKKQQIHQATGKEILLTPVDIGNLFVLLTEPTTSTVLVINSSQCIYPGSKIRSIPTRK